MKTIPNVAASRRGFAIPTAILVILVMTAALAAGFSLVSAENRSIADQKAQVTAFEKAHGGDGEFFGAPSGVAATVAMKAVAKACADGKITRAEVRKDVATTTIPKAQSLLGLTVAFTKNGDLKGGKFGIYQIQANGTYKPIG